MEKHDLDEYMEALWYLSEEECSSLEKLKDYIQAVFNPGVVSELQTLEYIVLEENGTIKLTEKGYSRARQIVRCHRLAERLLTDVMGMKPKETEKAACEFEHVLVPEIADSICTLLGHPRECPHGLKIPEGNCCKQAHETVSSAIVSLDKVKMGESVQVSYINTLSNSRMHKLSYFGIIPGACIKVHQRYPSFVIQCGNTQIAMEEDVAKEISVLYPSEPCINQPVVCKKRRWRKFRNRQ